MQPDKSREFPKLKVARIDSKAGLYDKTSIDD